MQNMDFHMNKRKQKRLTSPQKKKKKKNLGFWCLCVQINLILSVPMMKCMILKNLKDK